MPRDHPLLPYGVVLFGIAVYAAMDTVMKSATLALGAYNAMLFRSLIGFALTAPLWLAARGAWPAKATLRVHLLRGAIGCFMALTFFWGIARIPLAEAIALSFIAPLVALYLAAASLGERVERRAIGASVLGLAGVAVIAWARLGASELDREAALGVGSVLVSALLYAWNLVLQRRQALLAKPAEVAFFQNTIVGALLLLAAPWLAAAPAADELGVVAAGSVLSIAGAMLLSWGYARAEAQSLVPLEYSAFLWAALFGWLAFAEPVTLSTGAGALLIVLSCWIAAPRRRTEQTAL